MRLFNANQEVYAVYRVLVPLPVAIDWPSGVQVLELNVSDFPRFVDASLRHVGESTGFQVGRFRSIGHAVHTFSKGISVRVNPPRVVTTFFDRLVREGKADILHGPHCPLHYVAKPPSNWPVLDAYWTYVDASGKSLDDREG